MLLHMIKEGQLFGEHNKIKVWLSTFYGRFGDEVRESM